MSVFTPMRISPLRLKLDARNPRFLATQPTQENARIYLLNYAKVRELSRQIVAAGGLYPGERIVVYKDVSNDYIILEGNRRVCACQLLLDPALIPQHYQPGFISIDSATQDAINEVDVDVVQSREAADQFLAARHIGGVERWDPLAKKKFFEEKFASGQSINEIASSNNFSKAEIKKDITEYYLFHAAYSLPCWTDSQKNNQLNLFSIEIDRFIRIFNTRGAKSAFKLKYNNVTLQPESDLPGDKFSRILKQVMYCAYIATDAAERIDTRTENWRDVPEILHILNEGSQPPTSEPPTSEPPTSEPPTSEPPTSEPPTSEPPTSEPPTSEPPTSEPPTSEPPTSEPPTSEPPTSEPPTSEPPTPEPPSPASNNFFEALTWGAVPNLPENQGLIAVAEELKSFSQRPSRGATPYQSYPIAATTLLRSIVEQAFKFHLNKISPQEFARMRTNNRGTDPSLGGLIKQYRQNSNYRTLIPDVQMQRVFVSLFGEASSNTSATEEFLNLTIHQPTHVRPNAMILEGHASAGLFSLINYFLNNQ